MSQDQARQFSELGFAVFEGVLVGPLLDLLRAECDRFVAREDTRMDALGVDTLGLSHRGRRYFANECQRTEPALRAILFSSVMAEICRSTIGENAYFFLDQYVVKGPEGGMPFAWHQDSGYLKTYGGPDHMPYLTCWCPLDDATAQNGTVRLLPFTAVPESRHTLFDHVLDQASRDLVGWTGDDAGLVVEVPAGSVVAFSSHLLHTTGANRSDKARRAYLAQYTPEVILNPGSNHLRRNAIPLLRGGEQVTFS